MYTIQISKNSIIYVVNHNAYVWVSKNVELEIEYGCVMLKQRSRILSNGMLVYVVR